MACCLRTLATAAAIAPALMTPAHAHAPDGAAFVDAFRTACVPQRSSYEATRSLVRTLGWQEMDPQAHAELRQVNAIADEAISKKTAEGWTLIRSAYDGLVRGKPHYLVLTRVEAPDIITLIGCSLYDFDATEAIDPQIVTDFIGSPIARTHTYAGLVAHSWDPPPALPGTKAAPPPAAEPETP